MSRSTLIAFLVASAVTLALVSTKIRGADEIEYFSHLRSSVFDRDLDFTNEYEHFYRANPSGLLSFKETFLDRREPKTNRPLNFAPIGSAVLWSPFYLAAHALVTNGVLPGPADGFSPVYTGAVTYGSSLLAILGFAIAFRILRRFFGITEGLSLLAVIAVWFGTPAFYYMTVAPAFAHAPSIFAVSLLFFLWLRAREKDGVFDWVLTGLAAGLAMLVREQGILFLIAPGLDLLFRLVKGDVKRALVRGVAVIGSAAVVFLPQLLAYRALNGSFGPTQLVQRKMDFASPHFASVLVDPGHGLLLWTPLLLIAFFGLIRGVFRLGAVGLFVTLAVLAQVYINGAILSWHQAGAFGSRRFVDSSVLFVIGFAFGLMAVTPRTQQILVALAIWWNLSLMMQFGLKLMDRQRLDWPGVAVRQVTDVPQRILGTVKLYFTDPEGLARGTAMILEDWTKRFACPVCLDKAGCETCGVKTGGHDVCMKSYADRVGCACGGPNKRALEHRGEGFYCSCCLTRYPLGPSRDYADLLPRTDVGRVSHYADEEFQERLGVREGRPVLSAGVKARMVSRMLGLKPGDTVLDLGSGAGKFATHFASEGASVCGVDMAPFFLKSAIDSVSLVVGDLRRLPFRNGATSRAYSLDVLEHLDEAGVREVLLEARRAVAKDGRIFVYTHAMESSKIASFQRGVNTVAKRLGRMGLVDSEKEAMRKSDHINAIRSHEHFDEIARSAGLKVLDRVYYNVFAKAVVEDLALKVLEQRSRKRAAASPDGPPRAATASHVVGRPAPSASARFLAQGLTQVLMLDVALFGRVRTGPFFGVLSPA